MLGQGKPAAAAFLAAVLVLAAFAAGCSRQSDTSRASVESCVQFGIAAIKHHVTVTSLPPACQGLTGAQIDFAVGSALHSAAIGAHGKVGQRERIAKASHYLEHLVVSVPAQRGKPQVLVPAAHQIGRTTLGLIALSTWLITVALGLRMMIRWILRGRARSRRAGRLRRPPALDLAHLGLAGASLLVWIAYLATGVIGLAWTASALLPLVAGLGMTLVFLQPSVSPADSAAAQALRAATAPDPAGGDSSHGRRPPVVTVGAHVIFATATILFALLTAIGVS
jgi:hypothetical protein